MDKPKRWVNQIWVKYRQTQ